MWNLTTPTLSSRGGQRGAGLTKTGTEPGADSQGRPDAGVSPGPDLSHEQLPPALRAKLFAANLPKDHPIIQLRDASQQLFAALEVFTTTNTREPARVGFKAPLPDIARVDGVLEACDAAIQASTPVVMGTAMDESSVLIQSGAKMLRLLAKRLQGFLIFSDYRNGVPEDQLPGAVQECLSFQAAATNLMNHFSSLACGVVVQPAQE